MSRQVFKIENGVIGFKAIDPLAVGYQTWWQTPGGVTVDAATLADYEGGSATWRSQVTAGALTASPNTSNEDTPPTFTDAGTSDVVVNETSYSLDMSFLQDPQLSTGLSAYLFERDTEELYFLLGLNGYGTPPYAVGRCRAVAGAFGGEARVNLATEASLPLTIKPSIRMGNSTTNRIVNPPSPPRSNAAPSTVFPADPDITASTAPMAAKLAGEGFVAVPNTAWTTGQKITIGTWDFNWSGSAWAAGAHA